MNINATQEELEGIAEVLKLAAILDDRAPRADKARIVAWAEQIHPHKIGTDDLLAGLQSYYDSPSERAMQIGDLIHHAKTARQIRTSRESAAERERRENARDEAMKPAKEETHAIVSGVVFGPTPRTDRLAAAEDALHTCVDRETAMAAIREYHAARREARKSTAPVRR